MGCKFVPPEQMRYPDLPPDELVGLFAYKAHRLQAIRALVGGLTATELRRVRLTDAERAALIAGLGHTNPIVRWWCLQLIDHVGDAPCFGRVPPLLDDPVPRVRAMARHTLECERCKQSPAMIAAAQAALRDRRGYSAILM